MKKNIRDPLTNIKNKEKELELTIELPGMNKKTVELIIDPDQIEIRTKRVKDLPEFHKLISLPVLVNPGKFKKKFKNGILILKIKKLKKQPKRKMINLNEK
ncbi:Hsp20 family protein [archaeon]|jgi:HSP20 family molecular chaperone IbpA|nr:Hsp20 family protein [archaeon]